MATNGKLEGLVTVPTGGWTATVNAGTATIAAGDYYWSSATDLATAIANAFTTAAGFAVSVSTTQHGEGGTGVITLSAGSAFSVTWVSTDLRDIMGYTGNLSSGTSHAATKACRAIWLPIKPKWAPSGNKSWAGFPVADLRQTRNAAGYVWSFVGQVHRTTRLYWDAVPKARVWIADEGASYPNQSFERFWRDHIAAQAGWCANPCKVRWHPDASDDATFHSYTVTGLERFEPSHTSESWDGVWRIEIPSMIGVDS